MNNGNRYHDQLYQLIFTSGVLWSAALDEETAAVASDGSPSLLSGLKGGAIQLIACPPSRDGENTRNTGAGPSFGWRTWPRNVPFCDWGAGAG